MKLNHWLWCLIGLVVVAVSAVWAIDQHDARIRAEGRFADSTRKLAIQTAFLEQRVKDAASHLHASAETVTVKRIAYRTVRDTIILEPKTVADTVHDIRMLPALVRSADDALAASAAQDVEVAAYRRVSDSLVTALRTERDRWRDAKVFKPPRLTTTASALYDPISGTPSAALQFSARAIRNVSVVARGEQRFAPGNRPSITFGFSLAF